MNLNSSFHDMYTTWILLERRLVCQEKELEAANSKVIELQSRSTHYKDTHPSHFFFIL